MTNSSATWVRVVSNFVDSPLILQGEIPYLGYCSFGSIGDEGLPPENTSLSSRRCSLLGICFWRKGRGNQGWAEYMEEKGG